MKIEKVLVHPTYKLELQEKEYRLLVELLGSLSTAELIRRLGSSEDANIIESIWSYMEDEV